jgi:hypothetical protein
VGGVCFTFGFLRKNSDLWHKVFCKNVEGTPVDLRYRNPPLLAATPFGIFLREN